MPRPKKILENVPVYGTDEYIEDWALKLDSNENLFGPSPCVLEAFKNLKPECFQFYPCYGELLDTLSFEYGVDKKNILLTNGCDEAISVIMGTYLEQGDKVVSFSPTFAMPRIYTNLAGAEFIELEYPEKWSQNADVLIEAARKENAKVILMTSPNSPTGEIIGEKDIIKVLEACPHSLVLLDNTYINYSENPFAPQELVQKYSNLFVVKSFSKDFALAGLRLGFVLGQEAHELKKIISPYSVNSFAVMAGLESLKDKTHFEAVKKEVTVSKQLLYASLKELGYCPYKSETNFLLCNFGKKADFIYKKLLLNKIKVKNFGKTKFLENSFRITIPDANGVKLLLKTLEPKDLLVFDLDGVIFDVRNSYRAAIEKTYEHFASKSLVPGAIQDAKNKGGLNCDWDLTKHLLERSNVKVALEDVIKVFQEFFFSRAQDGSMGLIDNEELIVEPRLLESLSEKYDFAVFTGRPYEEAIYSLDKFGILKYFSAIVTKQDLPDDRQKPCPDGLELIKEACTYKNIIYFGDTSDDMKSASCARVCAVGILPPQDKSQELMAQLNAAGASDIADDINAVLKKLEKEKICV